jgi:hypothetical protein
VTHATLAQQPVATSAATGAQHLLPAAASFRPTTAHRAPSIATHAQRAIHATVEHLVVGKIVQRAMAQLLVVSTTVLLAPSTVTHVRRAMAQLLVASKTVRHAPSTETHVQRATIVHHALSIVMLDQLAPSTETHVQRATIVHHALSIVTHVQRATHAMAAHVRHLVLSIAQTHADHASSMTAHASSIATTAMTAPTVVQTALTV